MLFYVIFFLNVFLAHAIKKKKKTTVIMCNGRKVRWSCLVLFLGFFSPSPLSPVFVTLELSGQLLEVFEKRAYCWQSGVFGTVFICAKTGEKGRTVCCDLIMTFPCSNNFSSLTLSARRERLSSTPWFLAVQWLSSTQHCSRWEAILTSQKRRITGYNCWRVI